MQQKSPDLDPFFRPRTVALFGSFKESYFAGYPAVKQLVDFGFQGRIYPVNPRYQEVLGIRVYPSLKDVPEAIDLAMVMTSASAVPEILEQCAEKGVRAAVVVSDGFAERGVEGAELQNRMLSIARAAGIRIIGPNTAGTMSAPDKLMCCAFLCGYDTAPQGPIALIGQTGIIAPQAVPWHQFGCGLSKLIDLGNKCDVDESDVLEYLLDDPTVGVIAFHLEDVKNGPRFIQAARAVAKTKPILVLKPGRTEQAARAVASHTGSLAGDDLVFDSMCRQAGIMRVDRWSDLTNFSKMLAHQPLPRGNRLAIFSMTGGGAVLIMDAAARQGLDMAPLSAESRNRLQELFPAWGSNPVDCGPAATYFGGDRWIALQHEVMELLMDDDTVDCIAVATAVDPFGAAVPENVRLAERLRQRLSKPVALWIYGPIPPQVADLSQRLESLGFPVYPDPDGVAEALGAAYRYAGMVAPVSTAD